jgi:hypothetical protein
MVDYHNIGDIHARISRSVEHIFDQEELKTIITNGLKMLTAESWTANRAFADSGSDWMSAVDSNVATFFPSEKKPHQQHVGYHLMFFLPRKPGQQVRIDCLRLNRFYIMGRGRVFYAGVEITTDYTAVVVNYISCTQNLMTASMRYVEDMTIAEPRPFAPAPPLELPHDNTVGLGDVLGAVSGYISNSPMSSFLASRGVKVGVGDDSGDDLSRSTKRQKRDREDPLVPVNAI